MLKLPYRYILTSRNEPIKQRKFFLWFGWWYDYESYDNCFVELDEDMNELVAKLQKKYDKREEKRKERKAVINRVNNARGEPKDKGNLRWEKFPWYKLWVNDLAPAPKGWEDFLHVLKNGKIQSGDPTEGMEACQVVGSESDGNTATEGEATSETINHRSYDVTPESKNQNKKNKQQQQQQQPNNHQGN